MADSTLQAIKTKVRRLTRSPSAAQLSDADIEQYVNTFVLYDFPETLRLFTLRSTFTFYCEGFVDTYETNTTDPLNQFYDFKNKYITISPPIYVAGYQSLYSQSREQFFSIYPMVNNVVATGLIGNNAQTVFTGTIANVPVLRNNVTFTTVATTGVTMTLADQPIDAFNGFLQEVDGVSTGTINYITGAWTIAFDSPPAANAPIFSETVSYVPNQPQALLFYDTKFTLRPVPDKAYPINMEVFIRPTELLENNQNPDLNEWWQYIAYGGAIKILQDRMDTETVDLLAPEFRRQELMCLRRTIVQQTNQRTATIYTEQTAGAYGFGWWFGGGQF